MAIIDEITNPSTLGISSRIVESTQRALEGQQEQDPRDYQEYLEGLDADAFVNPESYDTPLAWHDALVNSRANMASKDFYTTNTKELRDYYGLQDTLSDKMIKDYTSEGRFSELDQTILAAAKDKYDKARALYIEEQFMYAYTPDEIKRALAGEGFPEFQFSLDDMIKFRAEGASKYLSQRSGSNEHRKQRIEDRAYKANVFAQLDSKYTKLRDQRHNFKGFGEFTLSAIPGVDFVRYAGMIDQMSKRGLIDKRNYAEVLSSGVWTGSAMETLSKEIWSMPREKFDAVMKFIDEAPVLGYFDPEYAPLFQQAFISDIANMTPGEGTFYNILDTVAVVGTYEDAAKLTSKGIEKVKKIKQARAAKKAGKLDEIDNIDTADDTFGTPPKIQEAPEKGKIVDIDYVEAEPVKTTETPVVGTKITEERVTLTPEEIASRNIKIKQLAAKREKVAEEIADVETALEEAGETMDASSSSWKFLEKKYAELSDYDNQILALENEKKAGKKIEPALVRATKAGDEVAQAELSGSRQVAGQALTAKITKQQGALETPEDVYWTTTSAMTGGEHATVPHTKDVPAVTVTDPTDTNPYISREGLETLLPTPSLETYDFVAANKLQQTALAAKDGLTTWINKNMPVDIITGQLDTQIGSTGLRAKLVFGLGPKGDKPLTKKQVDNLLKVYKSANIPVSVHKDEVGNLWLSSDFFLSADGTYSPLSSKNAKGFLGKYIKAAEDKITSIEVTGTRETIEDVKAAAKGRTGTQSSFLRSYKEAVKKVDKEGYQKAEEILQLERETNTLLTPARLREAADGDEDVINLVETVHQLNRIEGSLVNQHIYEQKLKKGFMEYDVTKIPNRKMQNVAGRENAQFLNMEVTAAKVDDVDFGDLNKPGTFTFDYSTGKLHSSQDPVTNIPEGHMVLKLDESIDLDGRDYITHIIVPETTPVRALDTQQIGWTPLAGWSYDANYYVRFKRFGKKNSIGEVLPETRKTVVTATTREGAERQLKALQEMSNVYNSKELDDAAKSDIIGDIATKHGLVGIADLEDFEKFLKDHNLTDLPSRAGGLYIDSNSYSPFDPSVLDNVDSPEIMALRQSKHKYHRGEYTVKDLTKSATSANFVGLREFMDSQAKRAGTLSMLPYLDILANRFSTKYRKLIDPSNPPKSPLDFLTNLDTWVNPETKTKEASLFTAAKQDANMLTRALQISDKEMQANKAFLQSAVENLLNSKNPHANAFGRWLGSASVSQRLQALAYNAHFLLDAGQFLLQVSTLIPFAVMHPFHGARALASFIPFAYMMNARKRGANLAQEAAMYMNWGSIKKINKGSKGVDKIGPTDLQALVQQGHKWGLDDVALDDIRGVNIYANPLKPLNSVTSMLRLPFNYGNYVARSLAFMMAAFETSKKLNKSISKFTDADWKKVLPRADIYSGGMSTANRRWLTDQTFLRPLAAMTSFEMMSKEKFIGSTLSPSEKAKLAAITLGLYGMNSVYSTENSGAASMELSDWAKKNLGVDVDWRWIRDGVLGAAVSNWTGYPVDTSRFATPVVGGFWYDLAKVVTNDNKNNDLNPTFYLSNFYLNAIDKVISVSKWFRDPESSDPEFEKMSGLDKAEAIGKELMGIIPALPKLERIRYAYLYNQYLDRNGHIDNPKDVARKDLLKKTVFDLVGGVKPLDVSWDLYKYQQNSIENYTKVKKEMVKLWTDVYVLKRDNSSQAQKEIDKKVKQATHMFALETQDWTSAQKQKALKEIQNTVIEKMGLINVSENPFMTETQYNEIVRELNRENRGIAKDGSALTDQEGVNSIFNTLNKPEEE